MGVAIPAAGRGVRMGGGGKAFLELAGSAMLRHTLRPFLATPTVARIVVALSTEALGRPPEWLSGAGPRVRLVEGGATRSQSVRRALEAFEDSVTIVLIHDAARPLVTPAVIGRCIEAVEPGVGVVAGWPVVDTLKEVDPSGRVVGTPDRSRFWRAQTPQAFSRAEILEAYRRASRDGLGATDDATVFTWAGGAVRMVEGAAWNFKVTHPGDLRIAEALIARRGEGDADR